MPTLRVVLEHTQNSTSDSNHSSKTSGILMFKDSDQFKTNKINPFLLGGLHPQFSGGRDFGFRFAIYHNHGATLILRDQIASGGRFGGVRANVYSENIDSVVKNARMLEEKG